MLVLSRKQGQLVELPEVGVVVQVVSVKGSRVQLGFEAPPEITINRVENCCSPTVDDGDAPPAAAPVDPNSDFSVAEARRIRDELTRMETEFAALAVLATAKDQRQASRIAGDSIQRLQGIKRSLRLLAAQKRREAQPIADLVKVRSEVLQQLRKGPPSESEQAVESITWPIAKEPSNHVREPAPRYRNRPLKLVPACSRVV